MRYRDRAAELCGVGWWTIMSTKESPRDDDEHYRSIFEMCPLPMWTYDRETLGFVAVNEAAVHRYGYSREEFAAMTLADIRPPEDHATLLDDVRQAKGFITLPTTWNHRKKDGSIITVEIHANDFVLDGRKVRLVLANDVTDRERARQSLRKTEEQLRQAQKMEALGRLAGGVAHDINNVLCVVMSYAAFLVESHDAGDARSEDAAEILRAAERAKGITHQLLTLSQHSISSVSSVDLNHVLGGFMPMLRRLVGDQIQIVTHRVAVPSILADRGQLEQVFMNLAINARDAMPEGGRLTLETSVLDVNDENAAVRGLAPGRWVSFAVTDTGTGMAETTRLKIFEPFFTTKDASRGTGLGLSIVHGIVSQAGGVISVYSELGHGTCFRIHLPAAAEGAVAAHAPEVVATPILPPALCVLIVDDDGDVRRVADRILSEAGCTVLAAATAEEARRVCVSYEGTIDVVVLDVVLSDGRGDVLVNQLGDLRPTLKHILMSGYPAGALSAGGGAPPDLLAKPFSLLELRAAVARVASVPRKAAISQVPSAGRRPRVLLADDDEQFRRMVARVLRRADCDVIEVDSGRKAIAELEMSRFDVILSDVQMPDGGGLDLLRSVRRVDLDAPVILMSGMPDVATATAAIEYGAFRFVTKPIDRDSLGKLVQHAARAHALARLRREAFSLTGTHAGAADRAGLEVRFEQAIERMWMAFQPIVEAGTGGLFGVEALVRTDEASMSNPHAFLEAATQLGRLPRLGRKVRAVSAAGITACADSVSLFVNLHPDDLHDADLISDTAPLTQIASRVVLEITERASLSMSPELTARLARLRQLGFRLAVDDIGSGYSGLTSFTELEPEMTKLDMSLVRGIHSSAVKQRTVAALCRLCRESGCMVVGEGVETAAERECLVALGVDLLQGYLIGRPCRELPAEHGR
jgi:hypothetical protein